MAKAKSTDSTRTFKRTKETMHDLFKLEDAKFLKNIAWQEGVVNYDQVTHVHYYHTVDSKGRPQTTSSHTGGHFHELIEVEAATDTNPATFKTSGPLKWALRKNPDGSTSKVTVPFDKNDKHTHDIRYIDSQKFVPRKTNTEAIKIIQNEEMKTASIPGIIG